MNKVRLALALSALGLVAVADSVFIEDLVRDNWRFPFTNMVLFAGVSFLAWLWLKGRRSEPGDKIYSIRLSMRRVIAAHASFFYDRCAGCTRCQMPWSITTPHVLQVPELFEEENVDVVALCEWCHNDTTPDQRLEFYGYYYVRLLSHGLQLRYKVTGEGKNINADWVALCSAVTNEENVISIETARVA